MPDWLFWELTTTSQTSDTHLLGVGALLIWGSAQIPRVEYKFIGKCNETSEEHNNFKQKKGNKQIIDAMYYKSELLEQKDKNIR